MRELLPITLCSILLGILAHFHSVPDLRAPKYLRKDRFFFCILAVLMIFFVGLRTRYNDTTAYTHGYKLLLAQEPGTYFDDFSWTLGDNFGFHLVNVFLASHGVSAQSFLLFYAAITLSIYVWFLRKYSDNLWLSVFLFITMGCFTFTLAAIKQCVAVAFCLVGTDRAIRKKFLSFVLWVLLATAFHPYSLMYLLVPFLMFTPWTRKTHVLLLLFFCAGILLQPLLGTVVDIMTMLGEEFDERSFSGEGVNVFRLAVVWVPVVLSFITRKVILARDDKVNNLLMNLSTINATIMFVGLFGTANYFARLANYFLIFQTLSLPWLLTHFEKKTRRFMTLCAILGYTAYFYYAEAIHFSFDALYSRITLLDYLKSIF